MPSVEELVSVYPEYCVDMSDFCELEREVLKAYGSFLVLTE